MSSFQFELNANNSVLRAVNFADQGPLVDGLRDPTHNMSFFLAQPLGELEDPVCPDLCPHPPNPTVAQIEEIRTLFEGTTFWNPRSTKPRPVELSPEINNIAQINSLEAHFLAELEITLRWPITRPDVADYVAAPNRAEWTPSWEPPTLTCYNVVFGSTVRVTDGHVRVLRDRDGAVIAEKLVVMTGDFYKSFDLKHYPFDNQVLSVSMNSPIAEHSADFHVVQPTNTVPPQSTEWFATTVPSAAASFRPWKSGKLGRHVLKVEAVVQRHYTVYLYRVVAVMAFFTFTALSAFSVGSENVGEQLGLAVTLMLTATAYVANQ